MRDKEGRGKHTPTEEDWVNSVNAGFKVAELLTKMNPRILFFCIESRIVESRKYSIRIQSEVYTLWQCIQ